MKTKLIVISSILLFFLACATKNNGETNVRYNKYKVEVLGIKADSVLPFNYFEDYLNYKKEQKKQALLNSPYLKIEKIYMDKIFNNHFYLYLFTENNRIYVYNLKLDSLFTDPIGYKRTVSIRHPLKMNFNSGFELKGDTLKVLNYLQTPFNKWKEIDEGKAMGDSFLLKYNYVAKKKPGKYEKKRFAKKWSIHIRAVYQPDLKIIKKKDEDGFDDYFFWGTFEFTVE